MGQRKKWVNEEMWRQAVAWKRGGLTYREIAGQLSKQENRKKFGLVEAPGEDTVRREVARRLSEEVAQVERVDPELGPHSRELFYFGQRFRDRLTLPGLGAAWCRWVDRSPDMWEGHPSPSLRSPLQNAEEEAMERNWGDFRYDAQKHPVFRLLEQHLDGHDCWGQLKQVQAALQNHHAAWQKACQLVGRELRARLPGAVTQTDFETLRESLLQGAYGRARGYKVEFTYEPYEVRDGWSLDLSGKAVGYVAQAELLEPYIQVHKELFDRLLDCPEVGGLVESERTLENAIGSFKETLNPDARLRKLILQGHCDLCP